MFVVPDNPAPHALLTVRHPKVLAAKYLGRRRVVFHYRKTANNAIANGPTIVLRGQSA